MPGTLFRNQTLLFAAPGSLKNSVSVNAHKMVERAVIYSEDCLLHTTPSPVFQTRAVGRHRDTVAGPAGSTFRNLSATVCLC